jgi:hypothetical protein
MIRFAVYDDAGPARALSLQHAHIVGKEDLTIAGSITFEEGVLTMQRHSTEAAAIALQVDVGPAGCLTLQTCLLPDRERPYLLDLELARHRIMLLLNKMEAWSLSDLPLDHPVMVLFEHARDLFTQALVIPQREGFADEVQQSRLARESLRLALDASERLAMVAADRDLTHRVAVVGKPDPAHSSPSKAEPGRPQLGIALTPDRFAEPLQRVVAGTFDFVSCLTRWSEIEREEGQRVFTPTDRWIEWAVRTAKLPVVGGPVLDLSWRGIPKWLHIWENDYKTLRELAYEHLKVVVTRYRRAINRWVVISGVNTNTDFALRMEEMIDLTRLAVLTVRKLQPSAQVIVDIALPFGEHVTHVDRSVAPILYAGILKESGIHFDAFGVRVQMGDGAPGHAARDLMALSAVLDTLAEFDKPIHVTAVGCPSAPFKGAEPAAKHRELYGEPGHWRAPWTGALQAEWMAQALPMILAKSYVQSACWQCLWDTDHLPEMRLGGLVTVDGKPKPALKRLADISHALRTGVSPTRLPPVESAG